MMGRTDVFYEEMGDFALQLLQDIEKQYEVILNER
jgi:hypothetical protein